MKMRNFKILCLAIIMTGCTNMCSTSHKDMKPEEVVEAYLDTSFNIVNVDQISDLIQYTSGNLKQALEAADAKTVSKVFVHKKYNLKRFSILERKDRTPREVEITYELAYNEIDKKNDDALVTAENTLNLRLKEGAWYITDVIGGKTAIDFQAPMVVKPN